MAMLTHQSELAVKRPSSQATVLFSQIAITRSLIIVLLTCLVLKPNILTRREICFLHRTKFLSQNNRLSNEIASNIQTVLESYSSNCQALLILTDGLNER